jgi:hypothetical protein
VCCLHHAQKVARILWDENIGSVPVVADGLDLKHIDWEVYQSDPVTCRDGENLEKCEEEDSGASDPAIPIVDGEGWCIGIVSQADRARKDQPEKVWKTVAEISRPEQEAPSIAA